MSDAKTDPSPARADLEARVDQARASIAQTVEEIKDTVGERIDAVKDTVTGVVSITDRLQREPVAWSLGALSAGFAMGYSLGRAHHAKTTRGRPSPMARLADDLASELAGAGQALVSAGFGRELKAALGVDVPTMLERIATVQAPVEPKRLTPPTAKRSRPRRTSRANPSAAQLAKPGTARKRRGR
jgi:hypothetical protein